MILMHQLPRVLTNDHGFLLYLILMGFWMEMNTAMKKKIKQLNLMCTIIVMHHLMRPTIKNNAFLI